MTKNHPITPPPELVKEWQREANHNEAMFPQVAAMAAQWGADQELAVCCALMDDWGLDGEDLMKCRRPKLPSLKEQALALLNAVEVSDDGCSSWDFDTIRRALEQLDD